MITICRIAFLNIKYDCSFSFLLTTVVKRMVVFQIRSNEDLTRKEHPLI